MELIGDNSRDIAEVIKNYENLLKSSQTELAFYKKEQTKLKQEFGKVLRENQLANSEIQLLRDFKKSSLSIDASNLYENEKLTNEMIHNLKSQINQLTEERNTLNSLWKASQNTIHCLETELAGYREEFMKPIGEVKRKYGDTIQRLENSIKTIRTELIQKNSKNQELMQENCVLEKKLKIAENNLSDYEKNLKVHENQISTLNSHLKEILKSNEVLENSSLLTKKLLNESIYRVQEALTVAENAIAEKDEISKREEIIREECDNLATLIGEVLEEASIKVESNVQDIREACDRKIDAQNERHTEMQQLFECQIKKNNLADRRAYNIEKKLRETIAKNVTLDAELQLATQAIVEMELKVEAFRNLIDYDQKSNKINEEREQELQQFLLNNKQIKDQWKKAMEEISKKMQEEIKNLQKENTKLCVENQDLKLKLMDKSSSAQ